MEFDWSEFLRVARYLQVNSSPDFTQEAAWRTAVSRAYYAAFGCARNRALNEGFIDSESAEDHYALREHFNRTGRRDVGRQLMRLRQWRNGADYQGAPENWQMVVKESIAEAQRLANRLK